MGHGTHVISLISSKYGVSDNVQIVSLKIFNSTHNSNVYHLNTALKFSRDHCFKHSNKCIINLSLGFDKIVEIIDDTLNDLYDQGFIIVASAGNSNIDSCLRSPSHLDNIITVGSIDYFDFKSSFSNFGNCTNLYTYGELIPGLNLNDTFVLRSGTSMSAPIVSGFVANLWSKNPNLNNYQIINLFYNNYLLTKNNLKILYTEENQYNLFLIFIPIFLSYLFFKILFCKC
jgi:subtilisin family serine protease